MRYRGFGLHILTASGVLVLLAAGVYAPPVGGVLDPFLADKTPKAELFRQLWKQAIEEEGKLEPLPDGVTGEQQRQRTVDAFERALSAMPEALPCPQILLLIGQLWNSAGLGGERPELALKAYERLAAHGQSRHAEIIKAISGQAYSYWLMKKPDKAAAKGKLLMEYQLPEQADQKLIDALAQAKADMALHLPMYLKEQASMPATRPSSAPASSPVSMPASNPARP